MNAVIRKTLMSHTKLINSSLELDFEPWLGYFKGLKIWKNVIWWNWRKWFYANAMREIHLWMVNLTDLVTIVQTETTFADKFDEAYNSSGEGEENGTGLDGFKVLSILWSAK